MDGEGLAVSCKAVTGSNPCGICDPESTISKFIQRAVCALIPSLSPVGVPSRQHVSSTRIETDSDDEYGNSEFTPEMAMVMDNVNRAAEVDYLA